MDIIHSIGSGLLSVALFVGGLLGGNVSHTTPLDMAEDASVGRAVNPVATNNYTIAGSGISSTANTITLTSFTAPVSGAPYTMANFGDGVNAKGYITIEPGSRTRQEIASFTGITQNSDGSATLTGVSRGLLPFSPFTASSSYAVAHNGGSQVVVSNPPQLYDAIYSYIDNATTSGAVDGTTLAKGIYETATGQEAASTTQIGGGNTTATLVLTSLISTSTAPSSGNVIPVTQSNGILSGTFCCNGSTTLSASTTIGGFNPIQSIVYASSSSKDFSGPSTVSYNFTIPGGTLGSSRGLHITGIITDYDSGAGNPPTSIRMSYGGTQLFDLQGTTNSSATENLRGSFDMYLFATSTSAQFGTGSYSVADNTDAEVGGFAAAGASTIDSTVDQTLTISFVQNTNSNITVQGVIVMRI